MGGCYTGRSENGKLAARRRTFDEVREPPYSMSEVKSCAKDLVGSLLLQPPTRESWWCCLTEMLLLCNEAANRQAKKNSIKKKSEADGVQSKPLGLEYIADRLDTDDPIFGYMVRSQREGWLQGFITLTTFTTWHEDFMWNSLVREAGISDDDKRTYKWDFDGSLANELQQQARKGDPTDEGIVWSRIAEVSLLGALACGSQLLKLVIEELELGDDYDYIVLQATDNAVCFYENMGFVRVGAIARPSLDLIALQEAEAQARSERRAQENEGRRERRQADKSASVQKQQELLLERRRHEISAWRDVCKGVLRQIMRMPQAEAIKVARPGAPTHPDQKCTDLASVLDLLDEGAAAAARSSWSNKENDPTAWTQEVCSLYGNAEECVADILLMFSSAIEAAELGSDEYCGLAMLKEEFVQTWKTLGDDARVEPPVNGESIATRFQLYVDSEGQQKRVFRLFEIYDSEENGSTCKKSLVLAREWTPQKVPGVLSDGDSATFLPKTPKATRLRWSPRRSKEGVLMSVTLPVRVSRKTVQGRGEKMEYVMIEDQRERITEAYTKLLALRAIVTAAEGYDTRSEMGKQDEDEEGKQKDGADEEEEEELNEYELQRKRRMLENQRIMLASGIVDAKDEVLKETARGIGAGELVLKKQREKRLSVNEDEEMPKRALRSRKSDIQDMNCLHACVEEKQEAASNFRNAEMEACTEDCAEEALVKKSATKCKKKEEICMEPMESYPENGAYKAFEDETPRLIARRFGCDLDRLLQMNKSDFPSIRANAKLKQGTLIRIPLPGDICTFVPADQLPHAPEGWSAYCHWTFPDQQVEELFPSYMMVRRLEHRVLQQMTAETSTVHALQSRRASAPPPVKSLQEIREEDAADGGSSGGKHRRSNGAISDLPDAWPEDGVYVCKEDDRCCDVAKVFGVDLDRLVLDNKATYPTLNKIVPLKIGTRLRLPLPLRADLETADWFEPCVKLLKKSTESRHSHHFLKPVDFVELQMLDYPWIVTRPMDLGTVERNLLQGKYASAKEFATDVRLTFQNAIVFNKPDDPIHQLALKMITTFNSQWSALALADESAETAATALTASLPSGTKRKPMFNKVVSVHDGVQRSTQYYFVLHYIPDMHWCHLAPMRQDGVFPATLKNGNDNPHAGRPRWKLVPEGEGHELDVSAERCRVVKSFTMNKTTDADKEAWDIVAEEQEGNAAGKGKKEILAQTPAKAVASSSSEVKKTPEVKKLPVPEQCSIPFAVWKEEFVKIISRLMRHERAYPFLEAVDPVALKLPDYFDIITRPMDLGTARQSLEKGEYKRATDVVADLRLIFENSLEYNPETDSIHAWATELLNLLNGFLQRSMTLSRVLKFEDGEEKCAAGGRRISLSGKEEGTCSQSDSSGAGEKDMVFPVLQKAKKLLVNSSSRAKKERSEVDSPEKSGKKVHASAGDTILADIDADMRDEVQAGGKKKLDNMEDGSAVSVTQNRVQRKEMQSVGKEKVDTGEEGEATSTKQRKREREVCQESARKSSKEEDGLQAIGNRDSQGQRIHRKGFEEQVAASMKDDDVIVSRKDDEVIVSRKDGDVIVSRKDDDVIVSRKDGDVIAWRKDDDVILLSAPDSSCKKGSIPQKNHILSSEGPNSDEGSAQRNLSRPPNEPTMAGAASVAATSEVGSAPRKRGRPPKNRGKALEVAESDAGGSQKMGWPLQEDESMQPLQEGGSMHEAAAECKLSGSPTKKARHLHAQEAPEQAADGGGSSSKRNGRREIKDQTASGVSDSVPDDVQRRLNERKRMAISVDKKDESPPGTEAKQSTALSSSRPKGKTPRKMHDLDEDDELGPPRADVWVDTPESRMVKESVEMLVPEAPPRTQLSKVTDKVVKKVADHLCGRTLHVSCFLPKVQIESLFQALESNRSVQRLDMEGCGLGDAGAERLAKVLEVNKRIIEIDLQMNQISDRGACALAKSLAASGVRQIHLKNNNIEAKGISALAKAECRALELTGISVEILGLSNELMTMARKHLRSQYKGSASPHKVGTSPNKRILSDEMAILSNRGSENGTP